MTENEERQCSCRDACCNVKEYLSCEEKEALGRMLPLKEEARRVRERIADLERRLPQDVSGKAGESQKIQSALAESRAELERLRAAWKDCKQSLEEANWKKLIALGHMNPDWEGGA